MTDLTELRRRLLARQEAKAACELLAEQVPELGPCLDRLAWTPGYIRGQHLEHAAEMQRWIEEAKERIEAAEAEQ